jgi:tetratricopeptide (TPR) repeat protein
VDRFALLVRKGVPLAQAILTAALLGGAALALEVPASKPPADAPKSAPAGKPAPAPAPSTTPASASAPPAATPATPPHPATREEQKSVYHDFRAAFDARRYAEARPLAERAVEITDQLDGRDSMALVTPLNNLAQTAYQLKDYSAAEENYLRSIKIIETRATHSTRLPRTLFGLGRVYVAAGQWEFAITMFKRAVEITRKSDGLFSTTQLPLLLPLIDAYAAADHVSDQDREEQYLVSIAERNYSPQSPEFLAAVLRQASWQERQFKFVAARRLYSQAIELIRRAGDVRDIRQVNPLRGIARCYRSEFLYGAQDAESKDPVMTDNGFGMGAPSLTQNQNRLEPEGERLLQTALNLLQNANGPAGTRLKRDTTIDLGDWKWVAGEKKTAIQNYATAWDLMTTAERASTGPENPLAWPYLLLYSAPRAATKNPKAKPEDIEEKFVQMKFPVNDQGKVGDIKVTNSDASESQQKAVMAALHRALYRPRFVDRKPAAADGVEFREILYNKR